VLKKIFVVTLTIVLLNQPVLFAEEKPKKDYLGILKLFDLGRIVVTPNKTRQPYRSASVTINTITASELEAQGVVEVTEALDMLPSTDILNYGGIGATKGLLIRGANTSQTLILVDGRPINTPRDGEANFSHIPVKNIERIEVLRGPASSIYGSSAVGGVINIITKSGTEEPKGEVSLKYGSYHTNVFDLTHGGKINQVDYFVTFNETKTKGHREHSFHEALGGSAKIGYSFDSGNRLWLNVGTHYSDTGTPGTITNPDWDDEQDCVTNYLDLTWDAQLRENTHLMVKAYQNFDRLEFIQDPSHVNDDVHQTKQRAVEMQVTQGIMDIYKVTVGVVGQSNRLNSTASAKHRSDVAAVYLENEFALSDKLSVKGGARWDRYSNFGEKISPQLSAHYFPIDSLKIHGRYGRSFRAPTFNDLYWRDNVWQMEGNENLSPESAESYELGVTSTIFDFGAVNCNYFINKFDDLIIWNMDNTFWWRPENLNKARTEGIEIDTAFFITDNAQLELNYTFLRAKDGETGNWLAYRPRHQFKTTLSLDAPKDFNVRLSGRFTSKRYTDSTNNESFYRNVFISEAFVMDADISKKLKDNLTWALNIDNLFDETYEEQEDYPMPGTSVYTSVTAEF